MRKLLAVALLAAFAVPASAATLGLNFVGGLDATNSGDLDHGQSITVEVTWTTTDANDGSPGMIAMAFNLTSSVQDGAAGLQTPDSGLSIANVAATPANWNSGGVETTLGGGAQFAVFASPADAITAPGTSVLGTFDVVVEPGAALGLHQFYIQRNAAAFSPDPVNSVGASYSFNLGGDGYSGQFNIGNGFAGKNNGSDAIPMNINVTPEPAALALLALGGVAVLRRRS